MLLAGLLLKLGAYGFLRFSLTLFPQASVDFAPLMLTLATIGILYGAIVAAMQRDLKKLVAYSSVAHLGFVVLGTFALTTVGIQGGVFTMVSHGLTTGALFLLVGILYDRRHTRQIDDFGGVWKSAPKLGGIFLADHLRLHRPPRPVGLRRGVPGADRHLRRAPALRHPVGGRGDPGRGLHAVGLPAGLHR